MSAEVEAALKRHAGAVDALISQIVPPAGIPHLSEPVRHHLATGGKRIRPALCLLTCESLGGDPAKAMNFAVAVELLHNMFLLHDDIEDGDTVRRDAPTVWVKYGIPNAINAGDWLLGRTYACAAASPLPDAARLELLEILTETYETTCRGQALDINSRGSDPYAVEDYIEMARLKTGRYLVLGMVGGAVAAGCGRTVKDALWELGENMGPAFQIQDDVIDLTLGKGRGGVLGSDIREGKASILYAFALSKAAGEERERLISIMRRAREETSDDDVRWTIDLYGRTGALDFASGFADNLVRQAFETIERLPVDNKEMFRQIARYMIGRKK
ncbi:MAG TPA: polyprenyl synthetase family protein [Candidatus Brocadiia bacterium]|nr:polyprenyl synthetase family protein [Candidatus Brocadiia bacterium]